MKTIWNFILEFLGYIPAPQPHQIGEKFVTMRRDRDCLVAAVATALGITYEQAYKIIGHRNLPWFLESPLLSNPLVAIGAIKRAGRQPEVIGLTSLLNNSAPSGAVVVLVHDPKKPTLSQHWVVWFGKDQITERHRLAWGDSQEFVLKTNAELIDLVTKGWPNCIIEAR